MLILCILKYFFIFSYIITYQNYIKRVLFLQCFYIFKKGRNKFIENIKNLYIKYNNITY